jgi:carboxymethylenebutenolidase
MVAWAPMAVPGEVRDPTVLVVGSTDLVRDGQPFSLYAAWTGGSWPSPGIVVVHEAFGLNPHIQDVCRRFAAQGFVAAAPDLFSRIGGPPAPGQMQDIMSRIALLDDRQAIGDLLAVVGWLRSHDRCNGRVGAIGFCMGGRLALLLATEPGSIDAAVDCWGGRITRRTATVDERHPEVAVDRIARLDCPLLGVFGEQDQNPNLDDVAELRSALQRHGKEFRIVTYPDAGHAFLADYRDSYRETAAFAAWEEILSWLGRLREEPAPC